MRISDRSSDVCSSDLHPDEHRGADELRAEHAPEGVPVRSIPPRCGGVLVTLSRNVVRCTPVPLLYGRGIGVSGRARWQIPAYEALVAAKRSEEHTSELQSLMRISYAVFCLKKNT